MYKRQLLTQIPNFTRLSLGGNEQVVTLLLTAFSLGIGAGSLAVESLSRRRIVLWVTLLGGAGMVGFGLALPALVGLLPAGTELRGAAEFLRAGGSGVLAAVVLLGVSGGLYIVPLFALIQRRAVANHRARVIAGVNILNAAFMVGSAVLAGALLGSGASIPQLISAVALLTVLVLLGLASALQRQLGGLGVVPEDELA